MKLLYLPDELLSTIILETMWATTTKHSNPPDLLMYERRLTNHPSIERKRVAFVGQICQRMRRIAQEHLKPAQARVAHPSLTGDTDLLCAHRQLWHDPSAPVQFKFCHPVVADAPTSLKRPSIKAMACLDGQGVFLPQLPSAALERLTDLSLSRTQRVSIKYSDDVLRSIGSCKQLRHLAIHRLRPSVSGTTKLSADIASIPTLQTLAVAGLYTDNYLFQPLSLSLGQAGSAPLIRLEIISCWKVTFRCFVDLMGKVAATIQVAIFHYSCHETYSPLKRATTVVGSFPQLWRLDIGFGYGGHPRYRPHYATRQSTPAGRRQVGLCSPIVIWKASPHLEYFDCSEQIVVKKQKELDEIGELRKREGMKRLRIKLETWEGHKGAGWSRKKMQELVVG